MVYFPTPYLQTPNKSSRVRPVAQKQSLEPVCFHYNGIPQIKSRGYNVQYNVFSDSMRQCQGY